MDTVGNRAKTQSAKSERKTPAVPTTMAAQDIIKIKRALVSVFDKTGIDVLGPVLQGEGLVHVTRRVSL